MIRIAQLTANESIQWSAPDRTFTIERELKLHLANGALSHALVEVPPYEKTYPPMQDAIVQGVSFVAYAGDQPTAEIRIAEGWNRYAHIHDLIVRRELRRRGLARALIARALEWATAKDLPGVMLETQTNNVPACQLYASCGFRLEGFDSSLYRGLDRLGREVALFWYWHALDTGPRFV